MLSPLIFLPSFENIPDIAHPEGMRTSPSLFFTTLYSSYYANYSNKSFLLNFMKRLYNILRNKSIQSQDANARNKNIKIIFKLNFVIK